MRRPSASTYRPLRPLLLLALTSLALSLLPVAARNANADAQPAPLSFAAPDFQQVWQQADGPVASGQAARSWLWGPAPGAMLSEPFAGNPGGTRLVQYFDKARMELNTAVTDTSSIWRVTTGLLVTEMVQGKVQTGPDSFVSLAPSQQVVAGDATSADNPRYSDFSTLVSTQAGDKSGQVVASTLTGRGKLSAPLPNAAQYDKYIPETGHNIADLFWSYMQQTVPTVLADGTTINQPLFDWLYVMGYPISEPVWASLTIDGKAQPALIQLFQRRVLTYVPSFPEGWQVQMGNVGQHYYNWRYAPAGSPATPTLAPTAQPAPTSPAGSTFVTISGDSFIYAGSKATLKGTNYWLSDSPFVGTWVNWDGPQVQTELEKAHELGANAVRIGISYDHHDTMDIIWGNRAKMVTVAPRIRYLMSQFLQIAALYNMKVIFVLFDWYDPYTLDRVPNEPLNLKYLQGIVGPFVNDDRVLAWDIYNEPEFSASWEGGKQSDFILWLNDIAHMVHSIDARHPVTVGVGNYSDLWLPAKNGTTIMSFVDFAAFHCYDAGALGAQIAAIKAHTSKPILLEEMGWPTSLGGENPTPNAVYDEPTQNFLYRTMLSTATNDNIAGVFQWTLWDYWGSLTAYVPGHERFFGLVKPDGSFKPAADIFKNGYSAPQLPSAPHAHVPLDTAAKEKPAP